MTNLPMQFTPGRCLFDFPAEEVRASSGHLGVPRRHQLMETFNPNPDRVTILNDIRLAWESLGLTDAQAKPFRRHDQSRRQFQSRSVESLGF